MAAGEQPDPLPADERGHLGGDPRVAQRQAEQPSRRVGVTPPGHGCGQHRLPVQVEGDTEMQAPRRFGQAHPVPSRDRQERRDVEVLGGRGAALGVRAEQVGVPLAVGVVHLCHDGRQGPVAAVAPEHGERVEHMAEDARVGEHEHPAARQVDAVVGEIPVHVDADGRTGIAEMVTGAERRQRPQRGRDARQVVQVNQPQVAVVAEHAPGGTSPHVGDPAGVERGAHQATPRDLAAWAPDRQPSSWKPQP